MAILLVSFMLALLVTIATDPGSPRQVSPENCVVWGPGLNPAITTPARYFFIHAVDTNGQRYTESAGTFTARVKLRSGDRVFVRVDVLDRFDGTYAVRYRLHDTEKDLEIHVYYDGKHVAYSPYLLSGMVYHEFCRCPEPDRAAWLRDYGCKPRSQITSDLAPFPQINMTELAPRIVKRFSNRGSHSVCHYKIIDNKIYLKAHGEHVDFRMFSNELFLSLTRKHKYQVSIDGTVAAYRLPYLMGGYSTILKQDSPYYEHFYPDTKPWVHYIPVKRDISDLLDKLKWAIANDDKVQQIAKNAREFVNENLLPHHLLCYHVQLFEEYSKRLVSAPIVDGSFEFVEDDNTDTYNNYRCGCDRHGNPPPVHTEL